MKNSTGNGLKPPVIDIKELKPKFITQVDPETGEIEWFCRVKPPKKKITGGAWVASFQDSLTWIAQQGLTGEQLSVFLAMVGKMDFDNFIRFSQTDLAEKLGVKQSQVSRSIKKLLELDIICEGPRAGLCKTYMLNPNIGMKGKQKKQKIIDYQAMKRAREMEKHRKDSDDDE